MVTLKVLKKENAVNRICSYNTYKQKILISLQKLARVIMYLLAVTISTNVYVHSPM